MKLKILHTQRHSDTRQVLKLSKGRQLADKWRLAIYWKGLQEET